MIGAIHIQREDMGYKKIHLWFIHVQGQTNIADMTIVYMFPPTSRGCGITRPLILYHIVQLKAQHQCAYSIRNTMLLYYCMDAMQVY